MPRILLVASVAAWAVLGCATPAPLVSLRPHSADVVWVAGRASLQQEQDGMRVAAAFEHQDGRKLAVRIEVENGTDQRLDISPHDVLFTNCATTGKDSCAPWRFVIDPEQVLAGLDRRQSIEAAAATNSAIMGEALLLLSVVGDTAAIAKGRRVGPSGLLTTQIAAGVASDAARHDSNTFSIAAQRREWADTALRRQTLFPGQGVSGLVYLPIDMSSRYVWVYVNLPQARTVVFCFDQTVSAIHRERRQASAFSDRVQ